MLVFVSSDMVWVLYIFYTGIWFYISLVDCIADISVCILRYLAPAVRLRVPAFLHDGFVRPFCDRNCVIPWMGRVCTRVAHLQNP